MPRTKTPPQFAPEALDAVLAGRKRPTEVEDLFRAMKQALMERPAWAHNARNGTTPKTILTDDGAVPIAMPRDRDGTFTPVLIPKQARRLPRFNHHVLSLYAHGMSVREIQAHLEELYQVATLRVNIRDEGIVRSKAVSLALGITQSGQRDVLGLWIEQTEGAHFCYRVMTDRPRVSPDAGAHVSRARRPAQPRLRVVQESEGRREGVACDRLGRHARGGRRRTHGVHGQSLRAALSHHRAPPDAPVGHVDGRVQVPASHPAHSHHHECHREFAQAAPQHSRNARALSDRRRGRQTPWTTAARRRSK